jgi:glucose-1-phosphate adenylyltransferase
LSATEHALTIVLALSSDTQLAPLTLDRAKAAIPFGGNYRIIDFTLTNCLRSGMRRIIVLTQHNSHSLHKHLRDGWSIYNPELGEYITPVPPQMRNNNYGYSGIADAILQNSYLLERNSAELVCIVPGDHLYRMDYAAMFDFHIATQADATVVVTEPGHTGYSTINLAYQQYRLTGIASDKNDDIQAVSPLGVYLFNKNLLLDCLRQGAHKNPRSYDMADVILPCFLEAGRRIHLYTFGGEQGRVSQDRYWQDMPTLDAYYEANMDLLRTRPPMDLYQQDWPIRTYQAQHPPARTVPGISSNEGVCINSIIASGTLIEGGGVNYSILFPRVKVGDAATVQESIIHSAVEVGPGAQLFKCIVDKDVIIPPGMQIGYDHAEDTRRFTVTPKGVVVIPKSYQFT